MTWATNSHVAVNKDARTYKVPAVTGDQLDERYGPFNVLKIDVEGFEVSVLRGWAELPKRRPKLILEVHPDFMRRYGTGLHELWFVLRANDYRGTIVTRPRFDVSSPFAEASVPASEVSNLHLA